MQFMPVETLSLREQFRLVVIAHETTDYELKKAALEVLKKYLNPLLMAVPDCDKPECREIGQVSCAATDCGYRKSALGQ